MKACDFFLAQLDAEAPRTRHAIENVPEGREDWRPHAKSMSLGQLANLVAMMPGWFAMMVDDDSLDLNPPGGGRQEMPRPTSASGRIAMLEQGLVRARKAFAATTDDHLMKPWRLLVAGQVVSEMPRQEFLRDTFSHLAHHRGQLTVYLRLNDAPVPAIYGPSADDQSFA